MPQALHSQVAAGWPEGRVRLVGHVEDIAAAYLAAHVTVVASTEPEAFGRTAIEAAAMGCPGDRHRHRRPARDRAGRARGSHGRHHRLAGAAGRRGALAERLAQALALARPGTGGHGRAGAAHVLAQFTVEAMQRRTLAVYDRLLGTVLERRFQVLELLGKFQRPCPSTTLTCGIISPILSG